MNPANNNLLCNRVSKMDNFLRKTNIYESVRYYERCIVEKSKRSFIPAYLILTDNNILLTQNPPKHIMDTISLAQISGIDLVADRYPVLSGGSDAKTFISQHICIQYTEYLKESSNEAIPREQNNNVNTNIINLNDTQINFEKKQVFNIPITIKRAYDTLPTAEIDIMNSDAETSSNSDSDNIIQDGLFQRPSSVSSFQNIKSEGPNANVDQEKRPSSADMDKRASVKNKIFTKFFPNKNYSPRHKQDKKAQPKERLLELNVYFYDSSSGFLNQSRTQWQRQILKTTLELERRATSSEDVVEGYRSAEHILAKFIGNSGTVLMKGNHTSLDGITGSKALEETYKSLCEFHKYLLKYNSLKYICWKNLELMNSVLKLRKEVENYREKKIPESSSKLITHIILLDVFKILIESYSGQTLRMKNQNNVYNDEYPYIGLLIQSAFSYGSYSRYKKYFQESSKSIEVIYNPEKFCSLKWTLFPDSNVIHALVTGHNISVSLIHEILSFSSGSQHEVFMDQLLNEMNLGDYLQQSVTQIVYLLWSKNSPSTPSSCVLLLCHLSVLQVLLNKQRKVKLYLKENFSEEFRYFLPEHCVQERISDEYPIKWKLVELLQNIRNDILN